MTIGRATAVVAVGTDRDVATDCSLTAVRQYNYPQRKYLAMQLFGTPIGTVIWLVIGLGTAALALANDNQITGVIAVGWIALAVFSFYEYRKDE
ncbi:hypothetical protein C493_19186 [Natronolimnohabitans innermongolicus JCM 12255]|uniref:Uncharacterized protein n=2 Tax=Natronolimnohabitans innermongolicus TaxID=253107 RepID=L9WM95_9EURY|nr:hypothetical protein C493_19186 [Natronolimnohabitans innermongolicus JCM 12255]